MRHYLVAFGLALIAVAAQAQPFYRLEQNMVGKVEFHIVNNGIFGVDLVRGMSGFTYPRGSGRAYMFGSGLWFGARKRVDGELASLVFATYDANTGASAATPGEYAPGGTPALPHIYNSALYDRSSGIYTGGDVRPNWPLWLRAGANATPMRAGVFEPENDRRFTQGGAYSGPAFVAGAGEQIVTRFHDGDIQRYSGRDRDLKGFPLGLQIQQNTFAWASGAYESTVLIQYQIVNVSSDTLHDCIAGQLTDPDLGRHNNDHSRFFNERPELRAGLVWTENEPTDYGVLGMALIEAPVTDAGGFVDNSRRGAYQLQGRVGSFQRWSIEEDPVTAPQRYEFIRGSLDIESPSPTALRTLIASSPFSMRPGDTAWFTVLFGIVDRLPGAGDGSSMLERVITGITADYYEHGMFSSVASAPSAPETGSGISLTAVPNPADAMTTLRIALPATGNASLRIVNALGQEVMRRDLGERTAGTYDERIDTEELAPGIYVAVVDQGEPRGVARFVVR